MGAVDHSGIVDRKARITPPLPLDGPLQLHQQPVANRFVHQQEIGGHAGLTGIEGLPPHDAPRSQLQIGLRPHDARTFPAQFERDGRQAFGRTHHDLAAESPSARVEDMVEPLRQQLFHSLRCVRHQSDQLLRKALADDLRQNGCRGRSARRRFQHHAVPCGQCPDERQQRQLQRVIPRRDDEHHAQRFVAHTASRRPGEERRRDAARPHPAFQVTQCETDFARDDADFGHVTLDNRFAQIGAQRTAQHLFVPPHRRLQRLQRPTPHRDVARGARLEIGPLGGYQLRNIHNSVGLSIFNRLDAEAGDTRKYAPSIASGTPRRTAEGSAGIRTGGDSRLSPPAKFTEKGHSPTSSPR